MLSITDAETLIIINFQTWFCHFEANFPSPVFFVAYAKFTSSLQNSLRSKYQNNVQLMFPFVFDSCFRISGTYKACF